MDRRRHATVRRRSGFGLLPRRHARDCGVRRLAGGANTGRAGSDRPSAPPRSTRSLDGADGHGADDLDGRTRAGRSSGGCCQSRCSHDQDRGQLVGDPGEEPAGQPRSHHHRRSVRARAARTDVAPSRAPGCSHGHRTEASARGPAAGAQGGGVVHRRRSGNDGGHGRRVRQCGVQDHRRVAGRGNDAEPLRREGRRA